MRRVRALFLLVALACAVLAGSTSVASAGGPAISTPHGGSGPSTAGKRWGSY